MLVRGRIPLRRALGIMLLVALRFALLAVCLAAVLAMFLRVLLGILLPVILWLTTLLICLLLALLTHILQLALFTQLTLLRLLDFQPRTLALLTVHRHRNFQHTVTHLCLRGVAV